VPSSGLCILHDTVGGTRWAACVGSHFAGSLSVEEKSVRHTWEGRPRNARRRCIASEATRFEVWPCRAELVGWTVQAMLARRRVVVVRAVCRWSGRLDGTALGWGEGEGELGRDRKCEGPIEATICTKIMRINSPTTWPT
jgi:hypothetical protein